MLKRMASMKRLCRLGLSTGRTWSSMRRRLEKSTISDLAKEASSFITRVKWALLEWEVDRLVKVSR